VLRHTTLRQTGAVLQLDHSDGIAKPGTISIETDLCVFDPRSGEALLAFVGSQPPESVVRAIYWTGEGAVVTPQTLTAQWRNIEGETAELNDAAFSIAGVARGPVQFAGKPQPDPAANEAQRWQAPFPTPQAPGIQAEFLPRRSE